MILLEPLKTWLQAQFMSFYTLLILHGSKNKNSNEKEEILASSLF